MLGRARSFGSVARQEVVDFTLHLVLFLAVALLNPADQDVAIAFKPRLRSIGKVDVAGSNDNPVSVAPGFRIGNVHVMAGVPSIFQAMLDNVVPTLRTGTKLVSATISCPRATRPLSMSPTAAT